MVKNNKNLIRLQSLVLSAQIIVTGYVTLNLMKPILTPSPYNGNSISINSDELKDKIRNIGKILEPQLSYSYIDEQINSMTDDQKKALLLLDAIYQNSDYTEEDLKGLRGYTQYLLDNKYINYENIYKIIKSSKLEKDVDLPNGIAGQYWRFFNKIELESYDSLQHEFFHLENHANHLLGFYSNYYNNTYQSWFEEGFSEVLAFEYTDKKCNSYPVSCCAIRLFTEFVGPDKMFETRSDGDLSILVDALINKGVEKSDVEELFDLLNEHNSIYKKVCEDEEQYSDKINMLSSLSNQISNKFITIYNQIYNTPDIVSPIFIKTLIDINENKISNINYYLFNNNYKKQYPYPQSAEKQFQQGDEQMTGLGKYDCYSYRIYYPEEEFICYEYSNGQFKRVSLGHYNQSDLNFYINGNIKNK